MDREQLFIYVIDDITKLMDSLYGVHVRSVCLFRVYHKQRAIIQNTDQTMTSQIKEIIWPLMHDTHPRTFPKWIEKMSDIEQKERELENNMNERKEQ